LIYSDTIINEDVIKSHFETAYKDEEYFAKKRNVFLQIAEFASHNVPPDGKMIDIGGATGDLAKRVSDIRPDVEITVSDLSIKACDYVSSKLGFNTICCQLRDLPCLTGSYDLAVLSDVLYYEPEIDKAWLAIGKLINNGTIIIRVPNKILPMRLFLLIKRLFLGKGKQEMLDRVDFFNPEHIYIFSRNYMKRKLKELGFREIKFAPSKLLISASQRKNLLLHLLYLFAAGIFYISCKKIVVTPSQLVYAQK
jgi:hypothetical protein